jgi:hypothetical protein
MSIFIVVAFFLFGSAWVRFVSLNTIVRFELPEQCQKKMCSFL